MDTTFSHFLVSITSLEGNTVLKSLFTVLGVLFNFLITFLETKEYVAPESIKV